MTSLLNCAIGREVVKTLFAARHFRELRASVFASVSASHGMMFPLTPLLPDLPHIIRCPNLCAAAVQAVLLPLRFPALFTGMRSGPRNVLLFGAPGAAASHAD